MRTSARTPTILTAEGEGQLKGPMDGFAEGMGPGFDEHYRELMEQLERVTRRIGLYLSGARVSPGAMDGKLVVMAAFDIGDLAWSNAVLDPAKAEVDEVVRGMDDDIHQAHVEEMYQEFLRRRGGDHES